MKPAALVATVFLALVAIGHLVRVLLRLDLIAAGVVVPSWVSVVACLFTGSLAVMLWKECRR